MVVSTVNHVAKYSDEHMVKYDVKQHKIHPIISEGTTKIYQ